MKKLLQTIFALTLSVAAQAQGDNQVIRILIGFPPGGNTDAIARTLSNEASKRLNKPIIVESRVGASGAIAAEAVARARPDGTTLLLATSANAILPALNKNLRYDAFGDFEWIGTFTKYPLVVAVSGKSQIRNFRELLQKARQSPGSVSYSSPGIGTTPHLTTELLGNVAGVKFLHIAYKGETPALIDLIGAQVEFSVLTGPTVLPRIRSGELRPLAVTGNTRWKALPDIPTVAESGYPSFNITSWLGLAAPRGTPAVEIARLNNAFLQAQLMPEIQKQIGSTGVDMYTLTPAETRELMQREIKQWRDRANAARVTAE